MKSFSSKPIVTRCQRPFTWRAAVFVAGFGLFVAASLGAASDWPQWRGPNQDGTSSETGLPIEFGPDHNLVWKIAMTDRSGSTPIVVGERLFLASAVEEELELWSVDASDGKVMWKRDLGGGNRFQRKHNMSSPSPVTDGKTVWAMTGTGIVKAFDFDGKELWARDLQEDYGQFGLNHGYGSSPLLADGVLYIPVLHGMLTDDPSYVLAIDGKTGETQWRVERPTDALMESPDAYTTPMIWNHHGARQLVITGGDYATGHSLEDGAELWRVAGMNPDKAKMYRVVASPVVSGNRVYVPSRVRPLLVLEATSASEAPKVAWEIERGPDVPTPSLHDGLLYLLSDKGLLSVWDLSTNEAVYQQQRLAVGTYSGSPLIADGRLYAVNEESIVTVAKLGREFGILAENELEGYTLSSPVAASGRLFFRTDKWLYCFDV